MAAQPKTDGRGSDSSRMAGDTRRIPRSEAESRGLVPSSNPGQGIRGR